jgi:hypothetical protein
METDDNEYWNKLFNSTPEQKEEMSDSEVLRAAVDIIANKLDQEDKQILQVSYDLVSTPNIWFKSFDAVRYVVVTFARYPKRAEPPNNASLIHQQMIAEGFDGYWIGVSFANEYEAFDPESDEGLALMRGFGLLPQTGAMIPMSDLVQ